ncbi:RIM-binding protein of the cytomatrix active zone domain-containing protein [Phthorimaea operculella]|nr:RIM-binding protein of the cytomatrix active zone domain-containing protein [Phthorimaea operculella]
MRRGPIDAAADGSVVARPSSGAVHDACPLTREPAKLYLREYGGEDERPSCREEWRRQERDWSGAGARGRLPQVDRSPSRRSPYLARDDEPSPAPDERGRSASAGAHHRARPRPLRYQSLERDYDRSYAPPPEDDYYRREPPPLFLGELQSQNTDLQRELGNLKKELELTNQKLGSSMHSIKTFWSPELKKERALRKEESAKYSLINDQLKLLNQENQKQAMLVRQLEEELRLRMRQPAPELQGQLEALFAENEHLQREIAILRDTIKELELRIETQKQTLQARDESIKKLLEMLQNKGMGKEEERQMFQQMQAMAQKQIQLERALAAAGLPGGSAGATLTAVLETKEARIATLERQVALLEGELAALVSPLPPPSLAPSHTSLYDKCEPPFKRQVSFLLNDVRVMKDGRTSAPPGTPRGLRPALRGTTLSALSTSHLPAPRYYSATTL